MQAEVTALNQKLFDHNFDGEIDPFELFDKWLALASEKEPMANAMSLATLGEGGWPDIRVVLLKDRTAEGFTFFTNKTSVKGQELSAHPKAALGFFWKSLNWQVRIRGEVKDVTEAAADAYFFSRPLGSRVGAHASLQSQPLKSKQVLMDRVKAFEDEFGEDVPRPPHWSGYTVMPTQIEFWCDGEYRLHDRVRFSRDSINESWTRQRLYP
jgi:pyridoxamine 5'-phosphate oxidase